MPDLAYADHSTPAAGGVQGVDVAHPFPACFNGTFANIATNTTTTVKSGAGFLHRIIVNGTAAGAVTVYDNTTNSGTKIATLKSSIAEGSYEYNVAFSTGLTIVTAAASDLTIVYR